MFIQYISSYPPYLEVVSSVRNLRTSGSQDKRMRQKNVQNRQTEFVSAVEGEFENIIYSFEHENLS
jgi:hypothetical protein